MLALVLLVGVWAAAAESVLRRQYCGDESAAAAARAREPSMFSGGSAGVASRSSMFGAGDQWWDSEDESILLDENVDLSD